MPIVRLCKICGKKMTAYTTLQNKCYECTKSNAKPIKQYGKEARLWEAFRDKVARPYLDNKYGMACVDCKRLPPIREDGSYYRHDVDHIKNKGSHPHLKFDVKNMAYRCRECHRLKTDGKKRM